MAAAKKNDDQAKPQRPPATTVEGRQNQLVNLAVDLAEKQLRDGTASSQTMSLYLKLGTVQAQQEQIKLEHEIELLKVKREAVESAKRMETLYEEAINSFRSYQPDSSGDEYAN